MDFGKLPEQGTIALVVVTACITTLLVGVFGKKLAEFVLELVLWPIRKIYDGIYRWVAPRNPLSISMRTYRRHVLRSNLTRMENPVGPNLDVPLEYAFAPLKLRSGIAKDAIDLYSHVAANHRCVILGGPGTGKTTLMKSLVTSIMKKHCRRDLNDLLPVFVVLRNLAKNQQTVFDAIVSAFEQYHFPGSNDFVRSSLEAGRMLIVLDGLDEVGANREFVVEQILSFCNHDVQRVNRNRLLVTCREHSYKAADLHDGIPEVLQVEPFTNHHMRIFLEGWPLHKGRSAIKLFSLIQEDNQLRDICRNPLLLTILTGLYLDTENFEIPSSRERFYQSAIDELLIRRPARRQIKQQFNVDDKRQILERVALERLETVGRSEDPEELTQEAIRTKAEAIFRTDKFDLHELLKELVDINGIIKPAQESSFTCAHRTILEYFAAREAIRSRETKKVVENFGNRTELIEVLYFYCGLLRNLPALTDVVRSFTAESRWVEAGRSLLHMSEAPSPDLVELVTARLHQEVVGQSESNESIEVLSSLANRRDSEFEAARRHFADAIDHLTASNDSGASALETAIATSPEIALKLIPGLLKHPSERWKAVGVQLLRDVGVDEALDKLVQLLNDNDAYIRRNSAVILAELIRSRNQALRQRAVLLPERSDRTIWPLERYFPGAVALPIAEAIVSSNEVSKSTAINIAVRALKARATRTDDRTLKKWRRVPLDIAFTHYRRLVGGTLFLSGCFLIACFWVFAIAMQSSTLIQNGMVVVSTSPAPVQFLSAKPMGALTEVAQKAMEEVDESYPTPKLSIAERILPWNWIVDPAIPDSTSEIFGQLKKWRTGNFDPFQVNLHSSSLQWEKLVPKTAGDLNRTIADLRQQLPPVHETWHLVYTGSWLRSSFLLLSGSFLLALSWVSRRRRSLFSEFVSFLFTGRQIVAEDRELRYLYIMNFVLIATMGTLSVTQAAEGSAWMRFSPLLFVFGFWTAGLVLCTFNWPRNSLLSTVDEVRGTLTAVAASVPHLVFKLSKQKPRHFEG